MPEYIVFWEIKKVDNGVSETKLYHRSFRELADADKCFFDVIHEDKPCAVRLIKLDETFNSMRYLVSQAS